MWRRNVREENPLDSLYKLQVLLQTAHNEPDKVHWLLLMMFDLLLNKDMLPGNLTMEALSGKKGGKGFLGLVHCIFSQLLRSVLKLGNLRLVHVWLFKLSVKEKLLSLMESNGLSSVEIGLARDAFKDPVTRRRMCGGRPFDVSLRDAGIRLAGCLLC